MWDVTVGLSVMSQPEWRTIFPCFSVDVLQDVDIIVVWCPAAEDLIVNTFGYVPGQPEWCGEHILGFWLMSCKRSMSGLSVMSQPEWCGGKNISLFFWCPAGCHCKIFSYVAPFQLCGGPHFLAWGCWCSKGCCWCLFLQDVDVIVKTFSFVIGWRTTFPRDENYYTLQKADKQNVDSKKNSYNSTVGGHVWSVQVSVRFRMHMKVANWLELYISATGVAKAGPGRARARTMFVPLMSRVLVRNARDCYKF